MPSASQNANPDSLVEGPAITLAAMLPRVDDLLAAPVGVALLDRLELAGDHRLNPAGSR